MEAKELMIGDWVYDTILKCNTQVEILSLSSIRGDCNDNIWNEKTFEPIPLTAEILEKNGFVNSGGLWHLSGEDMGLMQGCISFQAFAYYADPRYCFCEIAYLHELQHALRLCGIDKEIVL